MNAEYEAGIQRLIQHLAAMQRDSFNPTPLRKRYELFAQRAEEFATLIAEFSADDLEDVHAERGRPVREIRADGHVVDVDHDPHWPSLETMRWRVRELAESARVAADRLPSPREKRALPLAVRGLLHLRYDHGFPRPTLSDKSEDVQELARVCEKAGIHLSPERLRGALAEELKTFDPHLNADLDWILYGRS